MNHPSLLQHVVKHMTTRNLSMAAGTSRAFRTAVANERQANNRRPTCAVGPTRRVQKQPFRVAGPGGYANIHRRDGFIIKQVPDTFVDAFPTKQALLDRLETVLSRHSTYRTAKLPVALYGQSHLPPAKAYLNKLRYVYQGMEHQCPDERIMADLRDWYELRSKTYSWRELRKRGATTIMEFAGTMSYWGLYIVMFLARLLHKTTVHALGGGVTRKIRW